MAKRGLGKRLKFNLNKSYTKNYCGHFKFDALVLIILENIVFKIKLKPK